MYFFSYFLAPANRGGPSGGSVQEGHDVGRDERGRHGRGAQDTAHQGGRRGARKKSVGDAQTEGAQRR